MTAPGWYARGPQGYHVTGAELDGDEIVFERSDGQSDLRVPVPALTDAASAAEDAIAAKNDAVAAKGDAESARDAAEGHASTASGHASAASGSASAAAGFADDAEGHAEDAEGFRDAAAGSALAAAAAESGAASAVADALAAFVGAAPPTLDTIAELAAALQNNPDVIAALEAAIALKQAKFVVGSTTTAAGTAAKVVTAGSDPVAGDVLLLTFSGVAQSAASATLNVNGGGAKSVFAAGVAAAAADFTVSAGGVVPLLFDGTNFHLWGATRNSNTTYSVIGEAEIDTGTATTARAITAQRITYILGLAAAYADTKAAASHTHSAADTTSGTLDAARMPSGYKAIHVGTSPPGDTTAIWIDTN